MDNDNTPAKTSTDVDELEMACTILGHYADDLALEGNTGADLVAALIEHNPYYSEQVDAHTLQQIAQRAEEKAATMKAAPELPSAVPSDPDPVLIALESGDVKEIFNLAPILARMTPLRYGIIKSEIKERFGKSLNMNDLTCAVKDEQRRIKLQEAGEKKDVADIAREWALDHRDTWAYDRIAQAWRVWNGEYWQEQEDVHQLHKYAVAALQEQGVSITSLTGIKAFEVLAEGDCIREFPPRPGLINFSNGTLDIETMHLRRFRKEDELTYIFPYALNLYGKHPDIDRFLQELIPDEHARKALMAHAGLALMRDLLMHNFYVLLGHRRSGKSTVLALINAMCGATMPFSFAGHSIFNRDLEGKRSRIKWVNSPIVCIDEMPQEALKEEENLKTMSAHGGIEMRGMNKDEHTDNRWRPKMLMATNDQPVYSDTSGAIKERALFAEIKKARPKEERDIKLFTNKLYPEIGAFAATCLLYAKEVLNRGYYPLSADMKRLVDRISNEANPLKDFVQECCYLDPNEKVPTSTLHAGYKQYCIDTGHKGILATNTFSMNLRGMCIGVEPKHLRYDGILQRCLKGIRLREGGDPAPEDHYKDDEPLSVNGVNGANDAIINTVNGIDRPVETSDSMVLTVLTVKDTSMSSKETNIPSKNGHLAKEAPSQGRCLSSKDDMAKRPLTPLTPFTDGPVSLPESVNGRKSTALTPLTTVNSLPAELENVSEPVRLVWSEVQHKRPLWSGKLRHTKYKETGSVDPRVYCLRLQDLLTSDNSTDRLGAQEEIENRLKNIAFKWPSDGPQAL